jgi:hypothetical protein
MRRNADIFEYVAGYVDNLAFVMKDPEEIINILQTVHNFGTKGTGLIIVLLRADFFCYDDNTFCISPLKYIGKLVKTYE